MFLVVSGLENLSTLLKVPGEIPSHFDAINRAAVQFSYTR
jgi:hypothetical protein